MSAPLYPIAEFDFNSLNFVLNEENLSINPIGTTLYNSPFAFTDPFLFATDRVFGDDKSFQYCISPQGSIVYVRSYDWSDETFSEWRTIPSEYFNASPNDLDEFDDALLYQTLNDDSVINAGSLTIGRRYHIAASSTILLTVSGGTWSGFTAQGTTTTQKLYSGESISIVKISTGILTIL